MFDDQIQRHLKTAAFAVLLRARCFLQFLTQLRQGLTIELLSNILVTRIDVETCRIFVKEPIEVLFLFYNKIVSTSSNRFWWGGASASALHLSTTTIRQNELDLPCPPSLHFKLSEFKTISQTSQQYVSQFHRISPHEVRDVQRMSAVFCPDPLARSSSQLEGRQ